MEPQQNQTQHIINQGQEIHHHHHHGSKQVATTKQTNNSNDSINNISSSSSRWAPTAEQVRMLKELYYNNGIRSPSTEQIQRISARLRQYGKIEGKNVFYWFQNHKARERQKKRFGSGAATTAAAPNTSTQDHHHHHHQNHNHVVPMQRAVRSSYNVLTNSAWKSEQEQYSFHNFRRNNISPGYYSASSATAAGITGQVGYYGYGWPVSIEKHFKGCSISPTGGSINLSGTYLSIDHSSKRYNFFGKRHPVPEQEDQNGDVEEQVYDDDDYDQEIIHRTTLPLFPVHPSASDHHSYCSGQLRQSDGGLGNGASSDASLELSLSPYTRLLPD